MFKEIFENFDIVLYPLVVGILLSLAAAILGVVLVLKRYSMIGDGLSHVSFGAIAVAMAIGFTDTAVYIAIPVAMLAAYILLLVGENTKIKGDAAIGLISSAALAIGYLVGTMTNGFTKDINSYMFGSIALAELSDLLIIGPVALIVVIVFIFLHNRIFSVTFDEEFAKATGIKTQIYNILFSLFTAVTVVIGIRIMGTLIISSVIIFPALSAMQVFTKFKKVIIASAVISVICFIIAFFVFINFPSAAGVVIVNFIVFIIATIIGLFKRKIQIR